MFEERKDSLDNFIRLHEDQYKGIKGAEAEYHQTGYYRKEKFVSIGLKSDYILKVTTLFQKEDLDKINEYLERDKVSKYLYSHITLTENMLISALKRSEPKIMELLLKKGAEIDSGFKRYQRLSNSDKYYNNFINFADEFYCDKADKGELTKDEASNAKEIFQMLLENSIKTIEEKAQKKYIRGPETNLDHTKKCLEKLENIIQGQEPQANPNVTKSQVLSKKDPKQIL